ncbi:MAG: GNAT family N-acetyltransferase [Acidobacteriota bacterium]
MSVPGQRPTLRIRPLDVDQNADFDILLDLCKEHAEYERLGFRRGDQPTRWRRHLAQGRLRILFAEVQGDPAGEVVGYAATSLEYSTWAAREYLHLDCLYVRESARGLGVGTRLLDAAKDHARDAGCCEIQWQTPPWNEKAVGFYHRRGATSLPKLRFAASP